MPDFTYDVGRVSFIMKGAWNLATNYEKLDAVTHDGSLYIAKQDVPGGTAITNTTYWQLAAEKGDKGDTGGVDSINGQQGDIWFPDSRQLISDGYTTDTAPFLMKGNASDSDRLELAKKLGNTVVVNGSLDSADGTVLKSVGRNAFDGQLEMGYYNDNTGAPQTNTTGHYWRSENYFEAMPNTAYYAKVADGYTTSNANITLHYYNANKTFISSQSNAGNRDTTTPPNCAFIRLSHYFVTAIQTPPQGICVSLYISGESGYNQYYPHTVLAEVDTGSEVLRSAGTAADEKLPDGQITRRVGYVDLGTISWNVAANASGQTYNTSLASVIRKGSGGHHGDYLLSNLFVGVNKSSMGNLTDGEMSVDAAGNLQICKTSFANYSGAQIKTALSGVMLYYELATPTTEQGTAFNPLVATVKCGVLSWTNTKGIPVGQESHWFENLRKRVEDRLPDPPSGDGTYRLTCTISGGVKTYSWEA